MASSFGYKLLKTETGSVDDMPFEQFRVLSAMLEQIQKELANSVESTMSESFGTEGNKNKKTVFRIQNEE